MESSINAISQYIILGIYVMLPFPFSAGGHLSAWVGLQGENKPNGMILCYPAGELEKTALDTADTLDKVGISETLDNAISRAKNLSPQKAWR